jgi:uncharacterized membrane protein YqjE
MTETPTATIRTLVRDVLSDARELVREEVALLRAEVREQADEAKGLGMMFGGALVLALVGVALLCVAIAAAAAELFNVPQWASYLVLAVLLALGAYVLVSQGRKQASEMQVLPRTRESLRENVAWIQSKSSSK